MHAIADLPVLIPAYTTIPPLRQSLVIVPSDAYDYMRLHGAVASLVSLLTAGSAGIGR